MKLVKQMITLNAIGIVVGFKEFTDQEQAKIFRIFSRIIKYALSYRT